MTMGLHNPDYICTFVGLFGAAGTCNKSGNRIERLFTI